jgi:ubiquinone/menaquinone biosynthesis C-methylase UbiE
MVRLVAAQLRKPHGRLGRLFGRLMAQGHEPLYEWTLPMLHLQPTDTVLDIGCGSGRSTQLLVAAVAQGRVVGVDYSVEMAQQAHHRNRAAVQAGRASFLQGDVAALPYADAMFDKVMAVETFFFWPGPLESLREVFRVMKPGALLAITMEISKDSRNPRAVEEAAQFDVVIYSSAEMQTLLAEAGFHPIHIESLPEEDFGRLCALGTKPRSP